MFAVLAEDRSDFQTLKALIRRVTRPNMVVLGKGFTGVSELIKDAPKSLAALSKIKSLKTFIICADADKLDDQDRRRQINDSVVKLSPVACTVVVPTWELEAWIMADINAGAKIFGRWNRQAEVVSPENIVDAKEHLERLCKKSTSPPYNHATHNQLIIEHVDLNKVYSRCSSFRPLLETICETASVPLPVERVKGARSENFYRA